MLGCSLNGKSHDRVELYFLLVSLEDSTNSIFFMVHRYKAATLDPTASPPPLPFTNNTLSFRCVMRTLDCFVSIRHFAPCNCLSLRRVEHCLSQSISQLYTTQTSPLMLPILELFQSVPIEEVLTVCRAYCPGLTYFINFEVLFLKDTWTSLSLSLSLCRRMALMRFLSNSMI